MLLGFLRRAGASPIYIFFLACWITTSVWGAGRPGSHGFGGFPFVIGLLYAVVFTVAIIFFVPFLAFKSAVFPGDSSPDRVTITEAFGQIYWTVGCSFFFEQLWPSIAALLTPLNLGVMWLAVTIVLAVSALRA